MPLTITATDKPLSVNLQHIEQGLAGVEQQLDASIAESVEAKHRTEAHLAKRAYDTDSDVDGGHM